MPGKTKRNHNSKSNGDSIKLQSKPSDVPKEEDTGTDEHIDEQLNAKLIAAASRFAGPLPPPDLMAKYDQILPGSAERILKMAENEQMVSNEISLKLTKYIGRGQLFGFILGLVTIIGGLFLIYVGKDITGLASLLSGLGALLLAHLYGHKKHAETEE